MVVVGMGVMHWRSFLVLLKQKKNLIAGESNLNTRAGPVGVIGGDFESTVMSL